MGVSDAPKPSRCSDGKILTDYLLFCLQILHMIQPGRDASGGAVVAPLTLPLLRDDGCRRATVQDHSPRL